MPTALVAGPHAGVHAEVRVVGAQVELAPLPLLVEHHVEGADVAADVEHGGPTMGVMGVVVMPVVVAHEPATDNGSTS